MVDVFISYSRADADKAEDIARRLVYKDNSIQVWRDQEQLRPGDVWSNEIRAALRESASVLVLWSRQSRRSPWVMLEATAALSAGKLISASLDDQPPREELGEVHSIDLSTKSKLEAGVPKVAARIVQMRETWSPVADDDPLWRVLDVLRKLFEWFVQKIRKLRTYSLLAMSVSAASILALAVSLIALERVPPVVVALKPDGVIEPSCNNFVQTESSVLISHSGFYDVRVEVALSGTSPPKNIDCRFEKRSPGDNEVSTSTCVKGEPLGAMQEERTVFGSRACSVSKNVELKTGDEILVRVGQNGDSAQTIVGYVAVRPARPIYALSWIAP